MWRIFNKNSLFKAIAMAKILLILGNERNEEIINRNNISNIDTAKLQNQIVVLLKSLVKDCIQLIQRTISPL